MFAWGSNASVERCSRHVGFTRDSGRIAAAQRTGAMGRVDSAMSAIRPVYPPSIPAVMLQRRDRSKRTNSGSPAFSDQTRQFFITLAIQLSADPLPNLRNVQGGESETNS
jgi:hypothetical protein